MTKYAMDEYNRGFNDGYSQAKKEFDRPQGEWKYAYYPNINKEVYYCSNCGVAYPVEYLLAKNINLSIKELTIIQKDSRFNFCPCCGTDMRNNYNDSK